MAMRRRQATTAAKIATAPTVNWWELAGDPAPKKEMPRLSAPFNLPAREIRLNGFLLAMSSSSITTADINVTDLLQAIRTPLNTDNHIEKRYRFRVRNRGTAITAFCVDCKGFKRKNVTECMDVICPLWAFRFGTDPFYGKR